MHMAVGLIIGMAGAVAVGRLLQGVLVEVSATDPITLVGVPLLLVTVGFAAAFVPARRAMHVDPIVALREE